MANRRQFIQGAFASAAGFTCSLSASQPSESENAKKEPDPAGLEQSKTLPGSNVSQFFEPARPIPLTEDCDVIVCGGGPAGISAACAAARAGAKVRLFELQGALGGIWTSGMLAYIFDFDKCDTGWEIIRRLDALHARRCKSTRNFVYEPEYMKFVCEEMCAEAGVQVLLQAPVAAVYRDASGKKIETILTESKSGRQAWRAPVFIDATGDGDLAALAGCGFEMGISPEGFGQPATLNALIVVRDSTALSRFISNDPAMWVPGGHSDSFRAFLSEIQRAGKTPSYFNPTLFKVHENLLLMMINHEYQLRVDDAQAISNATIRARREILEIASALERLGGPWAGLRVAASAEQIGHRCGRRIHGRYTVTREDVEKGSVFEDGITTSRFGIDIHAMDFETNQKETISRGGVKFKPFQIPLRSLRARDVENLFMAGRCISGDFIAHASYRVTGSAVAMGEAAGKAAAELAKSRCFD
ncbi:MAG: FAD-dependent oxidoreductase [Planctomycetia bacterium]|nr:FAD-dependent oxidoreductase [Planctomycetia bacterium]